MRLDENNAILATRLVVLLLWYGVSFMYGLKLIDRPESANRRVIESESGVRRLLRG
jgi:hypothetical protein